MKKNLVSYRVVEHQNKIYEFNATSTELRAELLQSLIEQTKPSPYQSEWHELIATPFRYPLPTDIKYAARFRPPGSMKNAFYSSQEIETVFYEHAFHFLRFRIGMKKLAKTGQRTLFSVTFKTSIKIEDITKNPNIKSITSSENYESSYAYIQSNPHVKVIQYPSCRDPQSRSNFVTFDIECLNKTIGQSQTVSFSYRKKEHSIYWIENNLSIKWSDFLSVKS